MRARVRGRVRRGAAVPCGPLRSLVCDRLVLQRAEERAEQLRRRRRPRGCAVLLLNYIEEHQKHKRVEQLRK